MCVCLCVSVCVCVCVCRQVASKFNLISEQILGIRGECDLVGCWECQYVCAFPSCRHLHRSPIVEVRG